MTPLPDSRQPALARVTNPNTPAPQERTTRPRIVSGTAVWQTTAILNGKQRRGKLVVCADGRIYFGLGQPKLTATDTLNGDGQRLLSSSRDEVWVKDEVYQKLKELSAALVMGVSQ